MATGVMCCRIHAVETRSPVFDVCTLQVVLAAALQGAACHFLSGINPVRQHGAVESSVYAHMASEHLQGRAFFTRVVLTEEWCMLSAALLGEVASNLRLAAPYGSRYKCGPHGIRGWGWS